MAISPREQQLRNDALEWAGTAGDLRRLATWLLEQADALDALNDPPIVKPGRELVEVRRTRRGSYQLERIKCGKATCRCARGGPGSGHGPYWYAYWKQDGKTRSRYIGKELRYLTADELS